MSFGKRGFTFIEIILGMGIVIFLSASMFRIISVSNTQQGLNMNAEKVKAILRLAQAYSLSIPQDEVDPRHICGFGLRRNNSTTATLYYLYIDNYDNTPIACESISDLRYSNGDLKIENIKTITLDNGYTLGSSPSPDIFFKTPYGRVIFNGIELSGTGLANLSIVNSNTSDSKIIQVNSSGKINF